MKLSNIIILFRRMSVSSLSCFVLFVGGGGGVFLQRTERAPRHTVTVAVEDKVGQKIFYNFS